MHKWKVAGAALAFALPVTATQAFEALVESSDPGLGLEPFQFLREGEQIDLTGGHMLVLGYPVSCIHERITAGQVTIGERQSAVQGGAVERTTLSCGEHVKLSASERQESGASAWRDPRAMTPALLNDLAPLLIFDLPPEAVVIQRTDMPDNPIRLGSPGRAVDFARRGILLAAGGIYEISARGRTRTIEIDFDAQAVGGPALTRLVRF
ncbi:hypothetical protein [Minwuia sp.]|uniref:hypothetical protein n=1 Tax=Minwuia sp. TaxID=2493630 RepID=UPI003A92EDA6